MLKIKEGSSHGAAFFLGKRRSEMFSFSQGFVRLKFPEFNGGRRMRKIASLRSQYYN